MSNRLHPIAYLKDYAKSRSRGALVGSVMFLIMILGATTYAYNVQFQATVSVVASLSLGTIEVKAWPEKRLTKPGGNLSKQIQLKFYGSNDLESKLMEREFTLDATGNYATLDISSLTPGMHDIFLKTPSHLTYKFDDFTLDSSVTRLDATEGETKYLLAGDVNGSEYGDDVINALDLSIIIENLDAFSLRSDFNRDDIVNAIDLAILIVNLDKTGDV